MYVCVCNAVTDSDIHEAVDSGIRCMDGLNQKLQVANCCGRCKDCANRVLNQALSEKQCCNDMLMAAAV